MSSRIAHSKPSIQNKLPLLMRFSGSVLQRMWHKVVVIALHSAWVTILTQKKIANLGISNATIPVISIVVGLLLTYRTNTAYDRYWEARRLWSTLQVQVRNLARIIWVQIPADPDNSVKELLDRKSVINLLLAFAVATKHYLREEEGVEYDDLSHLVRHIPPYSLPSGITNYNHQDVSHDASIQRAHSRLEKFNHDAAGVRSPTIRPRTRPHERRHKALSGEKLNHNIPLEITIYLQSYVAHLQHGRKLDVPTTNSMNAGISGLVDCLSNLERILSTPIPLAYSIHLSQTVWIYCAALPFQLVSSLGWYTIPAVTLSSFILLGIASIGREIENPFGYDNNDLDLDDFCNVIKVELEQVTKYHAPVFDEWAGSPLNEIVRGREREELAILAENDVQDVLSGIPASVGMSKSSTVAGLQPNYNDDMVVVVEDTK